MADSQRLTVAEVAVEPRSGGAAALFSYVPHPDLREGDACFVPLGNRTVLGFCLALRQVAEDQLGFAPSALRTTGPPVEGLGLVEPVLRLLEFVASEYLCPIGAALGPAVPPNLRERLVPCWTLVRDAPLEGLTASQAEAVRVLREAGGSWMGSKSRKAPPGAEKVLRQLAAKGLVRHSLALAPLGPSRRAGGLLGLTPDAERIERFLREEARRKPAQALVLMQMQSASHRLLSAAEIRAMSGVTDATVRALVDAGLLVRAEPGATSVPRPAPTPNPHQRLAIEAVADAVRARRAQPFLLFGVTGSGKTEVYLRCAAEALAVGLQVLYLVPEIALATQAIAQLRDRFGDRVAIVHSDLPPTERLENWRRIRAGECPVVVGARSALFSPLEHLGLIVVDEEHESSYKQETTPRYHAKRLALKLGEIHRCPVLLGSATPSVESFWEAEQGSLTLLSLPERAARAARLPDVRVVDLGAGFRSGRPSLFADELLEALDGTLRRGEQAILFLNRRAYAPFLVCRECGHSFSCPDCAVSLALSVRERRLRCHHCGHSQAPPDVCPSCGGHRVRTFGAGTEKVEEAVRAAFPQARVARLDRDVAQRRNALDEILAGFRAGELDVLVGTQMVAKGLDFPNVTLVGVVAADVSLNLPDFRASERTFQLLQQVAGRAGRGEKPGRVVVQTLNPSHPAVVAAAAQDYLSLYESQKAEREAAGYPPFVRLVNVLVTSEDERLARQVSAAVAERLRALPMARVLGPADCALERIQRRFRRHALVKLPPASPTEPVRRALQGLEVPAGVQVALDVDPFTMV
ncbi:MAG: primosomal protein N' [Fimbriimonadales bacterium]|nr:primosomal protein N' [Fimbriimonadales bacterium]